MSESFELFKLHGLLSRLEGEDAEIVRDAIRKMEELERDAARARAAIAAIRSLTPSEQGSGLREALEEASGLVQMVISSSSPRSDTGHAARQLLAKIDDALSIGGPT